MILRSKERSEERNRRAALDDVVGSQVFGKRAPRAENVDPVMLEEAPVLGCQRRLDHAFGDLFERNGIIVQDAALADFVAVLVEELDAVAPRQEPAFVEFIEGRDRQCIEDDETSGAQSEAFRQQFVEKALPPRELEPREERLPRVPHVANARPGFREGRIDLGVEPQQVRELVTAALFEKPVAQSRPSRYIVVSTGGTVPGYVAARRSLAILASREHCRSSVVPLMGQDDMAKMGQDRRNRSRFVSQTLASPGLRARVGRGPATVLGDEVAGGNDVCGMGIAVRRLRPLLPQQTRGRGHGRNRSHASRLRASRHRAVPVLGLCEPVRAHA